MSHVKMFKNRTWHKGTPSEQEYNNEFSFRKRFRNRTGFKQGSENENRKRQCVRHPLHLKGREIGLWYAAKNKEKQHTNDTNIHKESKICISDDQLNNIKTLLSCPEIKLYSNFGISAGVNHIFSYENIADSDFKYDFLCKISGNIEDKLKNNNGYGICPNKHIDVGLRNDFLLKQNDSKYILMQEFREKLPSFKIKNEILEAVKEYPVILISGETGCGKTTQVAQFLLDEAILAGKGSTCKIACTQPRRISAISVAERVANERGELCGESVGYQIRLEKVMPRNSGSIIFCTTGVLLQKMESDQCLSEFSHLVIDEIHERNTISDFLLTILKQVIQYRKDLKIILMSATLNAEQFSMYYGNCPVIHIPGFTYPVEEFYLEDVLQELKFNFGPCIKMKKTKEARRITRKFNNEIEDYIRTYCINNNHKFHPMVLKALQNPASEDLNIDLIEALISHICLNKPDGAILVFLTGLANITKLHTLLQSSGKYPQHKFVIYPLHSKMPTANQKAIFLRPPLGVRKIIISTNIAETSITIDDVVYVIDSGKIKMTNFDPETKLSTLKDEWVSNANAKQRRGRAGRVQSGICYHLFSRPRSDLLDDYQKPEMLRTRIEEVILNIKILQLGDAATFLQKVLDPPDARVVEYSIDLLKRLNALDPMQTLTPLGYHLARLPMDPQTGKMILMGSIFSCVQPIFGIAASLSFKDAFTFPLGQERNVEKCKFELSHGTKSDHMVLAEALRRWEVAEQGGHGKEFCWKYFLNASTLRLLKDMKKQFAQQMHDMKFLCSSSLSEPSSNVNSHNNSLVRAVVCSGLYPNVAFLRRKKQKNKRGILHTQEDGKVEFHPGSVNASEKYFDSNYFIYYTKLKSTGIFLHDTTMVYPLALIFFGDNITTGIDDEIEFISVNGIRFRCRKEIAEVILQLRTCLDNLLMYKVSHPGLVNWRSNSNIEQRILKTISTLISVEDGTMSEDYEDSD